MIKFTYKPNAAIQDLILNTIVDVEDPSRIPGYLDETDSIGLEHRFMFLICDTKYPPGQLPVYSKPHAIVARSDSAAMEIFNNVTKIEDGSIMSIIETRCDKITVIPE